MIKAGLIEPEAAVVFILGSLASLMGKDPRILLIVLWLT
jgi:hypothetical protein